MKASIWVLIVIVVFLIFGSIMISTNIDNNIFSNPLFVLLLAIFSLMMLVCSYRQKFTWKKLGFHMCHLGVVTILIGACLGYFFLSKVQFSIPINPSQVYGQIQKDDGTSVDFGFGVSISDFKVTRYDPNYALYKPLKKGEESINLEDYQFQQYVKKQLDGTYDAGEYGRIEAGNLKDDKAPDGWIERYKLSDELILVKTPATDKYYLANMRIVDTVGNVIQKDLEVNKPVDYKHWRFYLMSYDHAQGQYVVLDAKRDPGRLFVIFGIWATIIGTALLCFKKQPKKGEDIG